MKKYGKGYPYLKALLDALIEAAPNWAKAPGKFVSSLSEQLKSQGEEKNKGLEAEIRTISDVDLKSLIAHVGFQQKNIELMFATVRFIPQMFQLINYRFDRIDEAHEEIIPILNGISV